MNTRITILLIVTVMSVIAGFVLRQWADEQEPGTISTVPVTDRQTAAPEPDQAIIGQRRPDFFLPDIAGSMHDISEWDGSVITINFWATWCPPCLKEIPELVELQQQYKQQGFQVIGIALQKPEELSEFIIEHGMNYPVLAGEETVIEVAENYGNNVGVLPYTAIIDRSGKIVYVKAGPVTGKEVEAVIIELL